MMRRILGAACAATALLGVTACGADQPADSGGASTAETPTTRTLAIRVHDVVPLSTYYNADDRVCEVGNVALKMLGETMVAPTLTVRDEADTVIASTAMPMRGGRWTDQGCVMPVRVTVPGEAKFYQVTVEGGTESEPETETQTVPTADVAAQTVEFDF